MLRQFLLALSAIVVGGQSPSAAPSRPPPAQLSFMDTTKNVPVGNYTLGYLNNTAENDCHVGVAKFQAAVTGQVSQFSFGAFSQSANETCGIGFVLRSLPNATQVGLSVSALFTDVVQPVLGTIEMIPFPVPTTANWNLEGGRNYTITIQPFTWTNGAAGSTASSVHCTFDVPYGLAGPQYGLAAYRGPTGLPCGSTPLTLAAAADNMALLMKLKGVPIPSATASPSPSPTTTSTPTPTPTNTPTGTATPTGTPTITDTPTPSLSAGATASITPTTTRTPSRTPSVSYSPTPTSCPTPSPTPSSTPTPTASLSFRATPSVTPTETPGPTDSHSPQPLAGVVAPVIIQHTDTSGNAGAIVGAAIGGAVAVVALIALAARYRAVSIEINGVRGKKWKHTPMTEINHNPLVVTKKSKFEVVDGV